MNWREQKAREAEEKQRERVSIAALHAAGRPCGRQNCPTCMGFAEALEEAWA